MKHFTDQRLQNFTDQRLETAKFGIQLAIDTAFNEFPATPSARWEIIDRALKLAEAGVSAPRDFGSRPKVMAAIRFAQEANDYHERQKVEDLLLGDWLTMLAADCNVYTKWERIAL